MNTIYDSTKIPPETPPRAISILTSILLFVAAHWDNLSPGRLRQWAGMTPVARSYSSRAWYSIISSVRMSGGSSHQRPAGGVRGLDVEPEHR